MQKAKPNINTMWGCMLAGDLTIRKLQKKAIVIVGDTRVGKSTLLNYLMKVPMEGVKKTKYGDVNLIPTFQKGVETKPTYESCTLVPNIGVFKLNGEKISLCDTAGFDDEARSYVGIFGVSYMLQKIFQNVNQVKFILVISHSAFQNQKLADMLKPFLNFVSTFRNQILIKQPELEKSFLNSIAIVANKARESNDYYLGKLERAIESLANTSNSSNSSNERIVVRKLLQSVLQSERLEIFKRAEDKKQIDQSQIMEKLSSPQKNWSFYSFQDNLDSSYLFQLPFAKQFDRILDAQKEQYKKQTENKHKLMANSYKLLNKFVEKAKNNWYSDEQIDYSNEFKQLGKLIKDHPYGEFGVMLRELGIELSIPQNQQNIITRLSLLQKFEQIHKAADLINKANQTNDVCDKINAMTSPCFEIFNVCRKTFCKTRQQQEQFITLMFINMRSLYQSRMQRKIDKGAAGGVPFIVSDGVTKIIQGGIQDIKAEFFKNFKPNNKERQKYTRLVNKTVEQIHKITDPQQAKPLIYTQVKNILKNSNQEIKAKRFKQALQEILKANKFFQQYVKILGDEQTYTKQEKQLIEFKQLEINKKMGACLQQMGLSRLAAELYESSHSIHLLIKCYQKTLSSKKKLKKKFQIMQDYAEILKKYGKKQKLIELYEQMIDQFQFYPNKKQAIKDRLNELLTSDLTKQKNEYAERLMERKIVRNIPQIIYKVQMELNYYVDQELDKQSQEDHQELFEQRYEGVQQQQNNDEDYD